MCKGSHRLSKSFLGCSIRYLEFFKKKTRTSFPLTIGAMVLASKERERDRLTDKIAI